MTIIQVDGAYYERYQYCNIGLYIDKGLEDRDQMTVRGILCFASDSAEAMAVLIGLREAKTRGFKRVEIQSDFEPIINHLEGLNPEPFKTKGLYNINNTVKLIRELESAFESVSYKWISRKHNNAHALSRR